MTLEAGATPAAGATPEGQQQGQPQGQQSQQQQPDTGGQSATDELGPQGIEALRREREARALAIRERDDAQRQLRELRDKDKPEDQRSKEQLTELQRGISTRDEAIRDLRIQLDIATKGAKLGIVDPELAVLLLQQGKMVEFDADGKPTNTEAALKTLVKERPYLIRATGNPNAGDGANGRGATPAQDMNTLIRRRGRAEG